MKSKLPFLLQGLFVVFLWSAQKIVMKMGLESIPPYFFAGLVQLLVFIILLAYMWMSRRKFPTRLSVKDKYMIMLSGIIGDGAAILFIMIGLQYVTGATAGLIATTSIIFNIFMAGVLTREKPKLEQYIGVAALIAGMVIFLGNQVLGGTLLGVALLLLAEVAFAFHGASNRLIAKTHKQDMALVSTLVGSGVGAVILVPAGLIANGVPQIAWVPPLMIGVVAIALISAFGELIWNKALDKLQILEISILTNTMVIQVAILSVLFLHETLTLHNVTGGLLVLLGALIVDGRLIFPKAFGLRMA